MVKTPGTATVGGLGNTISVASSRFMSSEGSMASRLQKRYALVAGKRIGNLRFLESGVLQYSSASVDQFPVPPDVRPRFHSAIAIASVARCVANATIQSFVEIVSQHHGVARATRYPKHKQ